jgi:ATP-dependent DNA ligase
MSLKRPGGEQSSAVTHHVKNPTQPRVTPATKATNKLPSTQTTMRSSVRLANHAPPFGGLIASIKAPRAATEVRRPFHRPGWVYEEKVDGWRVLV